VKGDGGVFDVEADGTLVFSKHEAGRFPEEPEVVEAIRALSR
jgi:selT/selW/selH-like putative selenoprotein